jgi:hypothetical protein
LTYIRHGYNLAAVEEVAMRQVVVLVMATLWLGQQAHAQQRPDFSGEWVLDRSASSLQGELAAVESGVVRIKHLDPAFVFNRMFMVSGKPLENAFDIRTDGKELLNADRGMTSRSRLEWQGNSLLLTVLIDAPRGTVSNVVRYELLDEGRRLRAVEDVGGAAPGHHNVWIFSRR